MANTKYKLTYFNYRLRPEPTRMMLRAKGVPFDDVRVTRDEWATLKPSTPFGKLPMLEVDGEQIAQSNAIARYVARKLGFAGKSLLEEAKVDAFVYQIDDFLKPWFDVYDRGESEKEQTVARAVGKTTDLLASVEKRLSDNDFLVGKEVTWADLHLMCWVEFIQHDYEPSRGTLDKYPEILAHYERVRELPGIKEWIRERPETEF